MLVDLMWLLLLHLILSLHPSSALGHCSDRAFVGSLSQLELTILKGGWVKFGPSPPVSLEDATDCLLMDPTVVFEVSLSIDFRGVV